LKESQKSVIESINKLANYTEKGISKWKVSFNLESKDVNAKWNLDYNVKFDQTKEAFSSSLKSNFDINANWAQKLKVNWKVDLDLVALSKKLYFNLLKFELDSSEKEAAQQITFIKMMVSNQIWKWFFINIPEETQNQKIDTKQFFSQKDKIVKILEEYPIFKIVKENKNKDYYDFDIVLDDENIIKITKEINALDPSNKDKKELTQEDINKIKADIKKADLKWKLKIDKKELKYYELSLANKNGKLEIKNTKDKLYFEFNDIVQKTKVVFDWKKDWEKISWLLTMEEKWKNSVSWNISFKKSWNNTDLEVTFDTEKQEKLTIKISDTTTEESVSIEAPKWAQDFQEVMWALMGWAWSAGSPAWMWIPAWAMPAPAIQ
jgi:hypothetical protein